MKKEKKFLLIIISIIFILLPIQQGYANEQETIQEQQEEFKIQDFIKNAKEYSGKFFENMNINEILNKAIKGEVDNSTLFKRILNLLGSEVTTNIKAIISILAVIIIHSILKSISESLENDSISKLIYYVQYILIVTIIMTNFTDIVKLVQETSTNLISFMNLLVPLSILFIFYCTNYHNCSKTYK